MNKHIKKIHKYLFGLAMAGAVCVSGHAEMAPNARAATTVAPASSRASGRAVVRGGADASRASNGNASRATTTRRVVGDENLTRAATVRGENAGVSRAATTRRVVSGVNTNRAAATRTSRAASTNTIRGNIARSATPGRGSVTRAATVGASRAGVARATAVFDDVSKIGGGYGECRDSYSTCMDQFCAKANETYRRCFCSERFTDFRNTEVALDEATALLARFEDNNLNAVDKTAAEVDAMYSATVGEAAIKNDTSGAAQILGEIGDLLSGKKKSSQPTAADLGLLDLDFSTGIDDIWGGGDDGIFADDSSSGPNILELEGKKLYNEAHKSCVELAGATCSNTAVFNMAKSSYEILISQDCNAYEKKINAQKNKVEQAVRTAEKYLREARLEDYRAHNSQDVNECIDRVRTALWADTACGENYVRCLDYTGKYLNMNTGEIVPSPRLFELQSLIRLNDGPEDADFMDFLETRKMFATTALDSCRDKADLVWSEFKRAALIEISQAQEEKLEETRMTCVATIQECYDTQGGALKEMDTSTSKTAGALSVYAAKNMCVERVSMCAALYGSPESHTECEFDEDGHIKNGEACGMKALLAFIDNVDDARIADGCATAVENYLKELCDPAAEGQEYPWKCRTKKVGAEGNTEDAASTASIWANVKKFTLENCTNPDVENQTWSDLTSQVKLQVSGLVSDLGELLNDQLSTVCEEKDGYWMPDATGGNVLQSYYTDTFGKQYSTADDVKGIFSDQGFCMENSTRIRCLAYNTPGQNDMSTYDLKSDTCQFTDKWYQERCMILGEGYYENGTCYIIPDD